MLPQYKTKTNIFIGVGLLIQLALGRELGPLAYLVGYGLVLTGCIFYAKAKGYHGAFGLFGLLSIIGLIVLVCLKDKCKDSEAKK